MAYKFHELVLRGVVVWSTAESIHDSGIIANLRGLFDCSPCEIHARQSTGGKKWSMWVIDGRGSYMSFWRNGKPTCSRRKIILSYFWAARNFGITCTRQPRCSRSRLLRDCINVIEVYLIFRNKQKESCGKIKDKHHYRQIQYHAHHWNCYLVRHQPHPGFESQLVGNVRHFC